ncbi:MAG: hypothetical protein ACFE8L_06940 [Candidatus Hodarchaeota archaeon]
MSDIYVPIDITEARKVIPEGEDIFYSTLTKAYYVIRQAAAGRATTITFSSHVLFTERGFAYSYPKNDDEMLLFYRPLNQIYGVRGKRFRLKVGLGKKMSLMYIYGKEKFQNYYFELKRDPSFESKEKFKERSAEFENKLVPLIIKSKEEFLNSPESSQIGKKERKNLANSIVKMKKREEKKKQI